MSSLVSNRFDAVPTEGMYLWRTASKLFYSASSSTLKAQVLSSQNASDASLSQIKPGYYVSDVYAINPLSFNVGSTLASDRITDANFYQFLMSLAAIGSLQNRYSAPSTSTWKRTQVVGYSSGNTTGWAVATATAGEGCFYASSLLNMVDSLGEVVNTLPDGTLKTNLSLVAGLEALFNAACEAGCNGTYAVTGCALTAGTCYPCPRGLRDYAQCTGLVTDKYSCAAAGLANFINTDTGYGWVQ
jgi:hypothetical protein